MKITVLSHNLTSNAVMRAHRLARAAQSFAGVRLIGPVERRGLWPALPPEPWIASVRKKRFPKFFVTRESSCSIFLEATKDDVRKHLWNLWSQPSRAGRLFLQNLREQARESLVVEWSFPREKVV